MAVENADRFAPRQLVRSFLGVIIDLQTYKNLLYLLLFFPLGMAYFVAGVTYGAIAFSFAVTIVLLPVALVLLVPFPYCVLAITAVERLLAERLAGVEFDGTTFPRDGHPLEQFRAWSDGDGEASDVLSAVWTNYIAALTTVRTWTGIVHHLGKFAVGTLLVVVFVVLYGYPLVMLFVPLTYETGMIGIHVPETITFSPSVIYDGGPWDAGIEIPITISSWVVDSLLDALLLSALGALLLLVAVHLTNLLAWASRWYARLLLR